MIIMDNKLSSQIKRGLKITTNYLLAVIVFVVFLMPVLTIFENNNEPAIFVYSIIIFLLMVPTIYIEMSKLAFKEKRPQYNINPSPFKGFYYGFIGVVPLILILIVLFSLRLPEDFSTLHKRLYQGFSGPLYWFAKSIGNKPVHYAISYVLLILMAGLGYYAGHKDFYLIAFIRNKLGKLRKSKNQNK